MAFVLPSATLAKNYAHICDSDPALDDTVDDFDDRLRLYYETGKEEELPLKDGQVPTKWEMMHLGELQKRYLLQILTESGGKYTPPMVYAAAAMSLVGTDMRDAQGDRIKVPRLPDDNGITSVPHPFMNTLAELNVINSIGMRALGEAWPAKKS